MTFYYILYVIIHIFTYFHLKIIYYTFNKVKLVGIVSKNNLHIHVITSHHVNICRDILKVIQ